MTPGTCPPRAATAIASAPQASCALWCSPRANPQHSAGGHVQHRVEVELALIGSGFGPIAIPLAVELACGEVPFDQVRRPPPAFPGPGGGFALLLSPRYQALLA